MKRSTLFRTCLVLATTSLPVAAFAAPPPASAPSPAPASSAPPADASAPPLSKAMEAKLDAHIASMHDQLSITPAQETQWNAFAQVMRDNAASMHAAIEARGAKMGDMNAADNMQSYAELAHVHADNMEKLATSFQTLYASLSDQQKQAADMVFRHEEARHEGHRKTG